MPMNGRKEAIKRNGTLSQLLRDAGVEDSAAWIEALSTQIDVRKMRQGHVVHIWRSLDNVVQKIVIYRSVWERVVAERLEDDAWQVPLRSLQASFEHDPTQVTAELVDVQIDNSLYQSLIDNGWDAAIAFELADVFAWDLDFYTDVQRGDRLLALVEVRRREESKEFVSYGRLLGAVYAGQAGRFTGFRYDGREGFFDESGRSLRKEFLKSPLKYAHITSKFGSRKHPVLGYTRQHAGTDFQAAVGTPVWAVGDGKVSFAGWQGGYGKFVMIRHPNGLETAYAHLSQIHVRVGEHVAQKAVIGMSGNTGLSSGPHLHFGLRKGGTFINPLSLKPQHVAPLTPEELPQYKDAIADTLRRLQAALSSS